MTAEGRSGQAASAEKLTEPQLSRPTGPAALTLTLPMRKHAIWTSHSGRSAGLPFTAEVVTDRPGLGAPRFAGHSRFGRVNCGKPDPKGHRQVSNRNESCMI